jgi:hypothetical protein
MGPGFAARVLAVEMIRDWVREGDARRRSSSVRAPRTRRIGIRRPQEVGGPRLAA